jgi:host factor-I protein
MEREDLLNIQNDFFNQARKDKARVLVFLNSGRKITGRLKSFDKFTLILETSQGDQMIFKHAIATVSSTKTFGNYINFDHPPDKGKEGPREAAVPGDDPGEQEPPDAGS